MQIEVTLNSSLTANAGNYTTRDAQSCTKLHKANSAQCLTIW